jgi:hypothetical protein
MKLKAGRCGLIVDGSGLGGFSCVVELHEGKEPQSFGFLSGPIDQLKAAQTAKQAQVDFGHGEVSDIRILQVSSTGIALIAVRGNRA